MQYKAIIMDIDGTSVPSAVDALPSGNVVRAIRAAQQIGVTVSVATSRPLSIAKNVIKALGITDPCVISDATAVYDPNTETVVKVFFLSQKSARAVKKELVSKKLLFMVNQKDHEYVYAGGPLPDKVCGLAVPDLSLDRAEALISALSHIPNISVLKLHSYKKGLVWVTITSSIATKLHGVLEITKMLGVDPKEVIGIGDGYNDYPLLSACGLKIAMGNAVPELKAIADFIAPPVEEDGVATVIEKFILS